MTKLQMATELAKLQFPQPGPRNTEFKRLMRLPMVALRNTYTIRTGKASA